MVRRFGIRTLASLLLAGTLASTSLPAADVSTALIGRWRSVDTSEGVVGAVFHFGQGGALEYSPATVVEMAYKLEGTTLTMLTLPPGTKGGAEQKQTLEWLADDRLRVHVSASGDESIELTRKGRPGDVPRSILGEWASPREIGGHTVEALYIFYPAGKALLVIPFLTSEGRYTVDGDKIHFSVPQRWTADGTFRLASDTLTLSITDAKGVRETRYARY